MRKGQVILFLLLLTVVVIGFSIGVQAEKNSLIPSWIKNNAKWWSEGRVPDSEFVNGIKYLIEQKIMKIENTQADNNMVGNVISTTGSFTTVKTDKEIYNTEEEIKISGSGFESGDVNIAIIENRLGYFLDRSIDFPYWNRTGLGELSGILTYPFLRGGSAGIWKNVTAGYYGNALTSKAAVNPEGSWEITLKNPTLHAGIYEIRVSQKIFHQEATSGSQTLTLKTARTTFSID